MLTKSLIVLGFAVAVWAFCGALVGIGRQYMSKDATLIVDVIGARMPNLGDLAVLAIVPCWD